MEPLTKEEINKLGTIEGAGVVHSVVFNKHLYNEANAERFLKKYNFTPIKKVHYTENTMRYRIVKPKVNGNYYTVTPKKGVNLVIMN